MAILEGGHIVPPRTQATSRSPAPLGINPILQYYQHEHKKAMLLSNSTFCQALCLWDQKIIEMGKNWDLCHFWPHPMFVYMIFSTIKLKMNIFNKSKKWIDKTSVFNDVLITYSRLLCRNLSEFAFFTFVIFKSEFKLEFFQTELTLIWCLSCVNPNVNCK